MDFWGGGGHKHFAANKDNAIAEENKNSSDVKMESEDVATTPQSIQHLEKHPENREKGRWAVSKGTDLDSIVSVVSEACKIHNCVKKDLQKAMFFMRRLGNAKAASSKLKSSFALMLLNSAQSSQSADVALQTTALEGKRKVRSLSFGVTIKKWRANKGVTMQSQYQNMEGVNSNTLLPPPLTSGANSNAEGDWEVSAKRNKRKQRK